MCHQHHVKHDEEFQVSARETKEKHFAGSKHEKQLRIPDSISSVNCSVDFLRLVQTFERKFDLKFIQRSRRRKYLQHR